MNGTSGKSRDYNPLLQGLISDLHAEYQQLQLKVKSGFFWKLTGTLNRTTTLGNRIYLTQRWPGMGPKAAYYLLIHELEHLRQYRQYGFNNLILGTIVFLPLYVLLPLPIGFAWFRYKFEREAYLAAIKMHILLEDVDENGVQYRVGPDITRAANYLTGRSYFWAWPFFRSQIIRWFYDNF